eukprot:TRINITY_DN12348_c0_g1_i2.p1 TRINITY_DN12348_c0_g1~~TRINITY_DN12348_c0_g1_i2.p1  ORF type:complete len:270 (-),score=55.84 TRINITY_DN12348_c0_g1_i2:415-1224(-)
MEETIPFHSWFEYITGQNEEDFRKSSKTPFRCDEDGIFTLENTKTGEKHNAGKFHLLQLGSTKKEVGKANRKNWPEFEVVTASESDTVDIIALQSDPSYKGALFQVASNFNAIEAPSISKYPEGDFTEKYWRDRTQGPAGSISAGASAIHRVHAMFYNKNTPKEKWMQTRDNQINFLDDIKEYFPVTNGYVSYSIDHTKNFPKLGDSKFKKLLKCVKFGYHQDVNVIFGKRDGKNIRVLNRKDQVISQVFSAGNDDDDDDGDDDEDYYC